MGYSRSSRLISQLNCLISNEGRFYPDFPVFFARSLYGRNSSVSAVRHRCSRVDRTELLFPPLSHPTLSHPLPPTHPFPPKQRKSWGGCPPTHILIPFGGTARFIRPTAEIVGCVGPCTSISGMTVYFDSGRQQQGDDGYLRLNGTVEMRYSTDCDVHHSAIIARLTTHLLLIYYSPTTRLPRTIATRVPQYGSRRDYDCSEDIPVTTIHHNDRFAVTTSPP
ncbi:hypothetical protein SAMN05444342_3150 [Haladaptatus paucihalophilus DX253]|uniref:Uncharacterized protein n=1 Tax=Haladaptatus paucihalophilus DX253 TaxID=797209 RepID=A0A1M6YIA4_HALPU|nr:hypothetical protein SAMN05444342_3150 [Haladaptatus paucihalophilus DX253]